MNKAASVDEKTYIRTINFRTLVFLRVLGLMTSYYTITIRNRQLSNLFFQIVIHKCKKLKNIQISQDY